MAACMVGSGHNLAMSTLAASIAAATPARTSALPAASLAYISCATVTAAGKVERGGGKIYIRVLAKLSDHVGQGLVEPFVVVDTVFGDEPEFSLLVHEGSNVGGHGNPLLLELAQYCLFVGGNS